MQTNTSHRKSSLSEIGRKIPGKRRSKKDREGLYEILAPESKILKASPTTPSIIIKTVKAVVTVRNREIARFGFPQERQTPLNVFADHLGPRNNEKLRGTYTKPYQGIHEELIIFSACFMFNKFLKLNQLKENIDG